MKRTKHKKRNIALLVLMALLCVSGVELAACRRFDPALYQQIMAPVRQGVEEVVGVFRSGWTAATAMCRGAYDYAGQFCTELATQLAARMEKPEEDQIASDPALQDDASVADPLVTELKIINGQEILTGGIIPIVYFNQGDPAWADLPYGSDNIGGYGCGPTAMAMAVASMTGQDIDPAAMSKWAVEQGYWAAGHGSYLSIVEGTAQAYGIQVESVTGRTPEELVAEIRAGKLLVALMGPGHFTQGGHFILLRGVTDDGEVLVADPNSVTRSLTPWDPQLLLDELSAKTANGAPLWALSIEEGDLP